MKNILILLLLAATTCAQAQTETTTLRLEKGLKDTVFVVTNTIRVFPEGTKVIEEVWRPQPDSSRLAAYLERLETEQSTGSAEWQKRKKQADENVQKIKDLRKLKNNKSREAKNNTRN